MIVNNKKCLSSEDLRALARALKEQGPELTATYPAAADLYRNSRKAGKILIPLFLRVLAAEIERNYLGGESKQ